MLETSDHIPDISAIELAKRMNQTWPFVIDVRESWELDQAALSQPYHHMPLSQFHDTFKDFLQNVNLDQEIVVVCHFGKRSFQTCLALKAAGYTRVYNLAGGLDAWARHVDFLMNRY